MVKCAEPAGRRVGDAEFVAALADPDNANVLKATLRRYANLLDQDERTSCGLKAVWRTLRHHRDDMGQKFTTSLVRFVHWECRREAARRGGKSPPGTLPFSDRDAAARPRRDDGASERHEEMEHVLTRLPLLPRAWQRRMLRQHFLQGMSVDEVGVANGCTREAARQRIRKAVDKLRELCLN